MRSARSSRSRSPRKGLRRAPPVESDSIIPVLAAGRIKLQSEYLGEPQLVFADKRLCEDPKTGLTGFGPYSKTDVTRRTAIRIGIVGPSEAIDRALTLVRQMSKPIPQSDKVDAMLHPSFPGINEGEPFQVEMVTQTVWHRALRPADVAAVENHPDFTIRVGLLLDAVITEIRALKQLDPCPDVVLVAMTEHLEKLCRVGIGQHDAQAALADDEDEMADVTESGVDPESVPVAAQQLPADSTVIDGARSFRRALKASCLGLLPTQLLWHRTLVGSRGVQDLATRAWNLSIALLYKAGVVPWRLADVMDGSCFVGVSFFHPDGAESSSIRSSVAQAFTDRGEGFVLQGARFEWDSRNEEDKSPHLSREAARDLLKRVLQTYEEQIQTRPRRVVIHKTSRYTEDERLGFEDALSGISHYGLVTLARHGTSCLRPGNKPVLRGTILHFGEKKGLVYTIGYIPFLRCYPGFRIPQPLEVSENWGSLSFHDVAGDLLRLTKLNWNTAAFSCVDPITLAFSKRVGEILRVANIENPALHYRYYM